MATAEDFTVKEMPQWCPGCGNFPLYTAMKNAMAAVGWEPHNTVLVSGIGCSGKTPHFVRAYGFETLHGRTLPCASGIKLANHELNVVAVGGDGDGVGIGMGHFVHIMRRNYNLTYIIHDNQIYGLTAGQTSPTSEKGFKSKSTPFGNLEEPVHPPALALCSGATFIARVFAGDPVHMQEVFQKAFEHKGFSFIDVLQPCVTFNKINTYDYWRARVYKLEETDHDPSDWDKAFGKVREERDTNWEKVPIGVFYKVDLPTYEDGLPVLKKGPLVKQKEGKDVSGDMGEFI